MKKLLISTICIACILIITNCTQKEETWKLVWEDNFDQPTGLDTTRWSKIPRKHPDWQNFMSENDACYDIVDGNLVLRGIINPDLSTDTAQFITGGVWSMNKVTFGEGRIEVRAKLGEAKGAWPAIWMLPQGKGWPEGGEIDIMEHLSYDSIVYQTVHTHYTYNLEIKDPASGVTAPLNRNNYNVYAVEMYKDSLSFFVNDKHTFTYPRVKTEVEGQFPFDETPFYLIISMQLGGAWVGSVDPNDLPVEMHIDWVKYYQKQ